jgi:hypothetical protein
VTVAIAVPEPSTFILLGGGLLILVVAAWIRARRTPPRHSEKRP